MPSMTASFDLAFGDESDIRVIRGNWLQGGVDLGINGDVYTISQTRCEICDEWGPCAEHLDLARSAAKRYIDQMPLPFDDESKRNYQAWRKLHDSLEYRP